MMKYTVEVSVQVVGQIDVEANSFEEAALKAEKLARYERGECLMLASIDTESLSATDGTGTQHEY